MLLVVAKSCSFVVAGEKLVVAVESQSLSFVGKTLVAAAVHKAEVTVDFRMDRVAVGYTDSAAMVVVQETNQTKCCC